MLRSQLRSPPDDVSLLRKREEPKKVYLVRFSIHHAACANFLGGQSVERRGFYTKHSQIKINLPTVMNFMLWHEAEPFPRGDGGVVGSLTFTLKVFVGETRENFHRFGMQAFDEGHHVFITVSEFFAVSCVTGGSALHVFGPHVTLGYGEMPKDVAERELSGRVGPIDFVRRDAARDAHGTLANISTIVQEWLNGFDFHGGLAH